MLDYLENQRQIEARIHIETQIKWAKNLIYGLNYIHGQRMIHRDINPKLFETLFDFMISKLLNSLFIF